MDEVTETTPPDRLQEASETTVRCHRVFNIISNENKPIADGEMDGEVGSVITWQCLSGYQLTGKRQATCQPNGQWSNPMPTCSLMTPTNVLTTTPLIDTRLGSSMQPTGDNRPLLKQSTGVIQDPVMLDTTTPTVLTGTTAARHDVLHAHSLPLVISVSSAAGIFLVAFITLICIYCLCSQKNKQRVQKIFSTDKPHPWSSNNGRNAHGRDYIALNPVYSPEFVDSLQGDERRADRWRHPSANARTINRVRSPSQEHVEMREVPMRLDRGSLNADTSLQPVDAPRGSCSFVSQASRSVNLQQLVPAMMRPGQLHATPSLPVTTPSLPIRMPSPVDAEHNRFSQTDTKLANSDAVVTQGHIDWYHPTGMQPPCYSSPMAGRTSPVGRISSRAHLFGNRAFKMFSANRSMAVTAANLPATPTAYDHMKRSDNITHSPDAPCRRIANPRKLSDIFEQQDTPVARPKRTSEDAGPHRTPWYSVASQHMIWSRDSQQRSSMLETAGGHGPRKLRRVSGDVPQPQAEDGVDELPYEAEPFKLPRVQLIGRDSFVQKMR